MNDIGLQS